MRPIYFDARMDPPRMDLLFAGPQPNEFRIVRDVRIRADVDSLEGAKYAAVAEIRAFSEVEIELLREVSVPVSREELTRDEEPILAVTAVAQLDRYPGSVFCPLCCRKLGNGDSPSIGYLTKCPGCQHRLTIVQDAGELRVIIRL